MTEIFAPFDGIIYVGSGHSKSVGCSNCDVPKYDNVTMRFETRHTEPLFLTVNVCTACGSIFLPYRKYDKHFFSQATVYLQQHELFTLEDLDTALQGVSDKATSIREDMQKAANRMKSITAIQNAVADCQKHQAVHDKYIKIGWKIRKEAYFFAD